VRDFVAIGAEHSSLGALARSATAAQGYRLSPDATPEEVSFIRSDQFSFIRHGIPALVLKSGYQAREQGLDVGVLQQQFRETNYHQPSDDLSLPLDYGTAADLARVDLRILLDAANAASAPRWNAGDFFAEKFGGSR
jgi:Zn-dependent M28 family amino/carboxypeptidase